MALRISTRRAASSSTDGRGRSARLSIALLWLLAATLAPLAAQQLPAAPAPEGSPSEAAAGGQAPAPAGKVVGAPERHIVVSWKKVEGAIRYEVLIRPLGGDILIDRSTANTSIHEVLPPGTYQVRVISYNLFDRPASQSVWRYLDVIQVFTPVVSRVAPSILYSGVESSPIAVDGANFLTETTVELLRDGKIAARATVEEVADKRLAGRIDLASVAPGRYDLRLGNPENLSTIVPGAVEVRPRIQPELSALSLSAGYNDRIYRQVAVRGTGFIEGTTFF